LRSFQRHAFLQKKSKTNRIKALQKIRKALDPSRLSGKGGGEGFDVSERPPRTGDVRKRWMQHFSVAGGKSFRERVLNRSSR